MCPTLLCRDAVFDLGKVTATSIAFMYSGEGRKEGSCGFPSFILRPPPDLGSLSPFYLSVENTLAFTFVNRATALVRDDPGLLLVLATDERAATDGTWNRPAIVLDPLLPRCARLVFEVVEGGGEAERKAEGAMNRTE